jgi:hypothetical protein
MFTIKKKDYRVSNVEFVFLFAVLSMLTAVSSSEPPPTVPNAVIQIAQLHFTAFGNGQSRVSHDCGRNALSLMNRNMKASLLSTQWR